MNHNLITLSDGSVNMFVTLDDGECSGPYCKDCANWWCHHEGPWEVAPWTLDDCPGPSWEDIIEEAYP